MGPPPITTRVVAGFHLAHAHIVAGHGDRLDQRARAQRNSSGEAVQGVGRHGPEPLERAGGIDPDELQVLADVAGGRRGRPGSAPQGSSGRTVTRSPTLPALHARTHRGDGPRHLVPHDVREPQPVGHCAVEEVQVGTADTAVRDANLHLARARCGRDTLPDPDSLVPFVKARFHKSSP